jgi:hypothetical protein
LEREALDSLSGGGSPLVGSPGAGEQLVSHWEAVVRNNGSNGEKRLSPEELVEVGLARKQALEEALGGEWKPALAALKQQATVPAAALQAVRAVLLLLGDETGSGSEWRALRRAVNTNRPQFDPNSLFGRMARAAVRAARHAQAVRQRRKSWARCRLSAALKPPRPQPLCSSGPRSSATSKRSPDCRPFERRPRTLSTSPVCL